MTGGMRPAIPGIVLRLFSPAARGCALGPDGPVVAEGFLSGRKVQWSRAARPGAPETVAVPMDRFVFRTVEIPPGSRKVLAGQLGRFLPLPGAEAVWQVLPVGDRSFLIASPAPVLDAVMEEGGFGKKKPFFISAAAAAVLHHLWLHDGEGVLAVPAGPDWLVIAMQGGAVTGVDLAETPPDGEDVVSYDDPEKIARGAALFSLAPSLVERDLMGKKPFPRLLGRALAASALAVAAAAVLLWSMTARDRDRLDRLEQALRELKSGTREIERIVSRNEKIEATADFLHKVNREYVSPYMVLADFTAALPEGTFLLDFFMDAGKGYVTGVSKDVTAVLEVVSARPYIDNAEFTTPVVRDNEGNERFQIGFSVRRSAASPLAPGDAEKEG